jgi:hypothetical protein
MNQRKRIASGSEKGLHLTADKKNINPLVI